MKFYSYLLLFIILTISTKTLAIPTIKIPVKITRFAYTGEHYMFTRAKSKIFKQLFKKGHLRFKTFISCEIEKQDFDWGSKTPIGQEIYELEFKGIKALYNFALKQLPASPDYPFWGGHERGIFIAIRDYSISSKDQKLINILLAKEKETKIFADETLHDLYAPLKKVNNKKL